MTLTTASPVWPEELTVMVWGPVVLRIAVTVPCPEAFVRTEVEGMKFTAGSPLENARDQVPVT